MGTEDSRIQKRVVENMRRLTQLHRDVHDDKISHEEAARQLFFLKEELRKLTQLGGIPLQKQFLLEAPKQEKSMPSKKTVTKKSSLESQYPSTTAHSMDFDCRCKSCAANHTPSYDDIQFLRALRILWDAPAAA